MRGRCTWSEFSDQKYSAILIFFPWKKTASASLAPFTEALAGLQTQDTLKSTAYSFACLLFTPAPNTQYFTVCCRLFPTAATWWPHIFSLCFPYTDVQRSRFPDHSLFFHSSPLFVKWSLLLAVQCHPPRYISHSCCTKSFIISCGFIVMSLNCNVRWGLQEVVIARIKPASTTGGEKKRAKAKCERVITLKPSAV